MKVERRASALKVTAYGIPRAELLLAGGLQASRAVLSHR